MADPIEGHDLLRRARAGDEDAFAALFAEHREHLRRLVRLRLDRRLSGRVDDSDVLQDAYLAARRRWGDYAREPAPMPLRLWLRQIAGQVLADLHRHHLGARMRDAGREVAPRLGAPPAASSASLAAQIFDTLSSPSVAAIRAEHARIVQEALNSMDPIDREILALRHFEQLSNDETALALGLSKSAASNRYIRALKRLSGILAAIPGLGGGA